jgi:hypothetical protein
MDGITFSEEQKTAVTMNLRLESTQILDTKWVNCR